LQRNERSNWSLPVFINLLKELFEKASFTRIFGNFVVQFSEIPFAYGIIRKIHYCYYMSLFSVVFQPVDAIFNSVKN